MKITSDTVLRLRTILYPVVYFIDEIVFSKELKRATGEILDLLSKAPPAATVDLYTPATAASVALDKGDLVSAQAYLSEIMTRVGLTAGVGGPAGQAPVRDLPILFALYTEFAQGEFRFHVNTERTGQVPAGDSLVEIKNIVQSVKDLNDPDKNAPKVKIAVAELAVILMKNPELLPPDIRQSIQEAVEGFSTGDLQRCRERLIVLNEQLYKVQNEIESEEMERIKREAERDRTPPIGFHPGCDASMSLNISPETGDNSYARRGWGNGTH